MINIMRSKFGDKPLSHVMKDPEMLKYALVELKKVEKLKKETELYNNPKTKMFGMLLKAKRIKEEETEAIENPSAPLAKRQAFCIVYSLSRL